MMVCQLYLMLVAVCHLGAALEAAKPWVPSLLGRLPNKSSLPAVVTIYPIKKIALCAWVTIHMHICGILKTIQLLKIFTISEQNL